MFYRVIVIDEASKEQEYFFKDETTALYMFSFNLMFAIQRIIGKKELYPNDFYSNIDSWEKLYIKAFLDRRLSEYVYFEELTFKDE